VPVESAKTEEDMKRLAYNVNNIELLCIPCHIKTHQEMRSHTKEKVKENKERRSQRFLEANDPNWRPDPTAPHGEYVEDYMRHLEAYAKGEVESSD
jgi:hemerythrin